MFMRLSRKLSAATCRRRAAAIQQPAVRPRAAQTHKMSFA